MLKLKSTPSKGSFLRFSQKQQQPHTLCSCDICVWVWINSFRSRPIPIEEKANATKSFSYSVAIVIDYPLLPVKDVGCNWLNRVFVFHCCRDHFFYKFRNQVIFASCSQRFCWELVLIWGIVHSRVSARVGGCAVHILSKSRVRVFIVFLNA